ACEQRQRRQRAPGVRDSWKAVHLGRLSDRKRLELWTRSFQDAPMIKIGEALPDANLMETVEFGEACPVPPKPISVAAAAKGKRLVIFGLPGAYTPTCSAKHVPGYVTNLDALKARGVDEVWCVSVNDGYVMA